MEVTLKNSGHHSAKSLTNSSDSREADKSQYGEFLCDESKVIKSYQLKFRDVLPQVFFSVLAFSIVIQAGVNMAYSTILINDLNKEFSTEKHQETWTASLVILSVPLGSLLVGPLMDRFGRKFICISTCIPILISWILMIFAQYLWVVYIARIIAGFSAGLTTVAIVYISEITHPNIRPMMLSLNSVFVSVGIVITCFLAVWLDWRSIAICYLFIYIFIFLLLLTAPESPYWIMCVAKRESQKMERVETIIRRLNHSKQVYSEELNRIQEIYNNTLLNTSCSDSLSKKLENFYQEFKLPTVYKPMIFLTLLFCIQQLTGTYIIIFYLLQILKSIENIGDKTSYNEYNILVLLGLIRFLSSIVTVFLSKKIGRRILMIFSGLGMSLSMLLLTICIHNDIDYYSVYVASLIIYIIMSNLGFSSIPWTLIGELLPISIKGIGSGLLVAMAYLIMFFTTKSYQYLSLELMFPIFAFGSILGTIFIYKFLPETLGRSFSDIEDYYNHTNKRKKEFNTEENITINP